MPLKKYRSKRNFTMTKEPHGKNKTKDQTLKKFVIQKHAAQHLHYDLRLEIKRVLKSWAVPKGPSVDPDIKRLAVEVEDHPLDYASFEGTIPIDQYGGGIVMIWDNGTWECEAPIKSLQKGDITFKLNGKKLKGLWKLIKLKKLSDSEDKNQWLLFKINDQFAKKNVDILKSKPNSIVTKRSLKQIAKDDQ